MEDPGWYQWLLNHIPVLEFLSLLAIALGVFCHFFETLRLRKAAQRHLENSCARLEEACRQTRSAIEMSEALRAEYRASGKPSLALLIEQGASSIGEGKLALQRISLKNIGLGTAFNVMVRSLQCQDYLIEFDSLDYIEKEASRALGFVASAGGHYSGLSRSLILLESALLAAKDAVTPGIPIEYSYADAFGNRYRTNVGLVVDQMSGKISVKYSNICSPELPPSAR